MSETQAGKRETKRVVCVYCRSSFEVDRRSRKRYCSRECVSMARKVSEATGRISSEGSDSSVGRSGGKIDPYYLRRGESRLNRRGVVFHES